MARVLITKDVRYRNGGLTANEPVAVYFRGTTTPAALFTDADGLAPADNPRLTDTVGNLFFFIEEGAYDFVVGAVRVPFDAKRAVHTVAAKADDVVLQIGDVTGLPGALAAREPAIEPGTTGQFLRGDKTWGTITKADLGLANVDNTSDAAKGISTAVASALAGKAALAHTHLKADVGLDQVDNTPDLSKPISTAVSTALAGKEPAIAPGSTSQFLRGDKTWATVAGGGESLSANAIQSLAGRRLLMGMFVPASTGETGPAVYNNLRTLETGLPGGGGGQKFDLTANYNSVDGNAANLNKPANDYTSEVVPMLTTDPARQVLICCDPYAGASGEVRGLYELGIALSPPGSVTKTTGQTNFYNSLAGLLSAIVAGGNMDRVVFSFAHELNGSSEVWHAFAPGGTLSNGMITSTTNPNSPALYKAAYRAFVTMARELGYKGRFCQWYLTNNSGTNYNDFNEMYAGDEFNDLVGLTYYNRFYAGGGYQSWEPVGRFLRAPMRQIERMSERPVWICEGASAPDSTSGSFYASNNTARFPASFGVYGGQLTANKAVTFDTSSIGAITPGTTYYVGTPSSSGSGAAAIASATLSATSGGAAITLADGTFTGMRPAGRSNSKTRWIDTVMRLAHSPEFARLGAFIYFNANVANSDWTLQTIEQKTVMGRALGNSYRPNLPVGYNETIGANLLAANVAIPASTTGWTVSGVGATVTVSIDTDVPMEMPPGSTSLKVTKTSGNAGVASAEVQAYALLADSTAYVPGDPYTLSFYAKSNVEGALLQAGMRQGTGSATIFGDIDIRLSTGWERYAVTLASATTASGSWRDPWFGLGRTAPEAKVWFTGIKRERGSRETPFIDNAISKAQVGLGSVDNTADSAKPVSTATQTALDAKASATALTAHAADTTNPHAVTKAQVGLGSVDNTADTAKPVSTAQQSALDAKASTTALAAHVGDVTNPHGVTKAQVGLGLVDNTSDAAKPISSAQQTALDAKASAASLTSHTGDTTNPHAVTKSQVGLGNADNTSDANKPVSTATQTALNGKASTAAVAAKADYVDMPLLKPTGCIRQSIDLRYLTSSNVTVTAGRAILTRVYYLAGDVVTNLNAIQGATAGASLTHTWMGLADASYNVVAVTADDTTSSRAIGAAISMNLTSAYTIPSEGWYWHIVTIAGTTPGTLSGTVNPSASIVAIPGVWLSGASTSGLTTPSAVGTALTAPTAQSGGVLTWSK